MPRDSGTIQTNWTVLIAGAALFLTTAGGIWSLVNPKGDTERLEKRIQVVEDALQWKFVSKELLAKDIEFVRIQLLDLKGSKTDKDIYDQKTASLERQITLLRDRLKDLDHSVNQTFNTRDALAGIHSRILELERAGRSKP